MVQEHDSECFQLSFMRDRRLILSALVALPWASLHAQGMCVATGSTLDELLAKLQDPLKKAQIDKESYVVVLQRQSRGLFKGLKDGVEKEEMGIVGRLSVNGKDLGTVVENESLRIKAGEYAGVMRYVSKKNFVQGPLGELGTTGDFLLEIAGVTERDSLLFHPGTKPWHSRGCVLAGAAQRKKVGDKDVITISDDSTLRQMRRAFYGTDAALNACPNKTIKISIRDI